MRAIRAGLSVPLLLWCVAATTPARAQDGDYYQVLYDTTEPVSTGYRTGLGFAVYVHFDGVRLLFDTGADPATLAANLQAAGIEPAELDLVAISHGHSDHAGGLGHVRAAAPGVAVYAAPGQRLDGGALEPVEDHLEITPDLYLIRSHTTRPTSGIADELSLLIRTARGPYLITACSHTGVATILERAARIAGQRIFHYAGGARLDFRPPQDTLATTRLLAEHGVAQVSPGHCSAGHEVAAMFQRSFDTGYLRSRLGERVALAARNPAGD